MQERGMVYSWGHWLLTVAASTPVTHGPLQTLSSRPQCRVYSRGASKVPPNVTAERTSDADIETKGSPPSTFAIRAPTKRQALPAFSCHRVLTWPHCTDKKHKTCRNSAPADVGFTPSCGPCFCCVCPLES